MTPEELTVRDDRMRYTKDKLSSGLILLAIVFDALYFVSIYKSDVGSYFYTWVIGASIIYNLVFMLAAFLASEGVKSRKNGYTPLLIVIAVMQVVRIFYVPWRAHSAVALVSGQEVAVMGNGQFCYTVACLAVSAACCAAAAFISLYNNRRLAQHMRTIQNQSA